MSNTSEPKRTVGTRSTGVTELPSDLALLLDVGTAARIGGFSGKFIRDMLSKGVIEGVKIGGAWRVNRDAYLKQLGLL